MKRMKTAVATIIVAWFAMSVSPAPAQEKTKILVMGAYADAMAGLEEKHGNLELVVARSSQEAVEKVGDCVAVVGISPAAPTGEILRAGKNVRWVQTMSAGLENYLRAPELKNSDIVLTSAKILQGPEIADHAMEARIVRIACPHQLPVVRGGIAVIEIIHRTTKAPTQRRCAPARRRGTRACPGSPETAGVRDAGRPCPRRSGRAGCTPGRG